MADKTEVGRRALAEVRELSHARPTFIAPEIDRLTAALLRQTGADPRAVEQHLRAALEAAASRGALALQLRAAVDLRRLQLAEGQPADAQDVLRDVVRRFTEGPDAVALTEARALLS